MESNEFLGMKLEDISDLLLDKLDEDDSLVVKVDLPGCRNNERFVLHVILEKVGENDD